MLHGVVGGVDSAADTFITIATALVVNTNDTKHASYATPSTADCQIGISGSF